MFSTTNKPPSIAEATEGLRNEVNSATVAGVDRCGAADIIEAAP